MVGQFAVGVSAAGGIGVGMDEGPVEAGYGVDEAVFGLDSDGMSRRVAIARALAGEPSLLLCDEPTGNLDSVTAATVLGLLDDLHADGMTILMITHDADVASRAQRVVSIRDGVLSE